MTRRALIPNFTFEHEISGRSVPRAAREQEGRWRYILRLAPGFDDAVPIEECPEPDEVVAWGFSKEARALAGAAASHWPSLEVVRTANDKRTSHSIERDLGVALPGACIVSTAREFDQAIGAIGGAWLAKHPFGVSGRDQVRGEARDPQAVARAEKLLKQGHGLVVEPLLTLQREWSVHFDIGACGEVVPRGATGLITDCHGIFRGNIAPATDLPAEAISAASDAVGALAAIGYRGPVGVDGHLGMFDGRPVLRPIGELNARLTFGRLALWLSDSFGGRRVAWHHPSKGRSTDPSTLRDALPESIDPGGHSGTTVDVLESDPSDDPNLRDHRA